MQNVAQVPSNFSTILATILEPNLRFDDLPNVRAASTCLKCRTAVYTIIKYFDEHNEEVNFTNQFETVVLELCKVLTSEKASKCEGYAKIYTVSPYTRNSHHL